MPKDSRVERGSENFWHRKKKLVLCILIAVILIISTGVFLLLGAEREPILEQKTPPIAWLKVYFDEQGLADSAISGLSSDPDSDGLTNLQEYDFGTNPIWTDTDFDGSSDGHEVAAGTDPLANNNPAMVDFSSPDVAVAAKQIATELSAGEIVDADEYSKTFGLDRPLVIPQIADAELRIVPAGAAAQAAYEQALASLGTKYASDSLGMDLSAVFVAADPRDFSALQNALTGVVADLRKMPVPAPQAAEHKKSIIFYEALKRAVDAKVNAAQNPDEFAGWDEIVYQFRILTSVNPEVFNDNIE